MQPPQKKTKILKYVDIVSSEEIRATTIPIGVWSICRFEGRFSNVLVFFDCRQQKITDERKMRRFSEFRVSFKFNTAPVGDTV